MLGLFRSGRVQPTQIGVYRVEVHRPSICSGEGGGIRDQFLDAVRLQLLLQPRDKAVTAVNRTGFVGGLFP